MDGDGHALGDDLPLPPSKLFDRLSQVPGYTWDHSVRHLPIVDVLKLTSGVAVCTLSLDI